MSAPPLSHVTAHKPYVHTCVFIMCISHHNPTINILCMHIPQLSSTPPPLAEPREAMSSPQNGSSLAHMPLEIQQNIFFRLDMTDLCNLRRTCRAIENSLYDDFFDEICREIHVVCHPVSMDRFRAMASVPKLAEKIQAVHISTHVLRGRDAVEAHAQEYADMCWAEANAVNSDRFGANTFTSAFLRSFHCLLGLPNLRNLVISDLPDPWAELQTGLSPPKPLGRKAILASTGHDILDDTDHIPSPAFYWTLRRFVMAQALRLTRHIPDGHDVTLDVAIKVQHGIQWTETEMDNSLPPQFATEWTLACHRVRRFTIDYSQAVQPRLGSMMGTGDAVFHVNQRNTNDWIMGPDLSPSILSIQGLSRNAVGSWTFSLKSFTQWKNNVKKLRVHNAKTLPHFMCGLLEHYKECTVLELTEVLFYSWRLGPPAWRTTLSHLGGMQELSSLRLSKIGYSTLKGPRHDLLRLQAKFFPSQSSHFIAKAEPWLGKEKILDVMNKIRLDHPPQRTFLFQRPDGKLKWYVEVGDLA
ncbi:unnamed protein product [Periconia digitata]|uniref:F-box domain-containing protein n=1 Tax=Periconia digitata TaxID=1303443 RepID=A0A9W4UT06_9PLEO|nr:unnamed protein product [Periconia digitata]